MTDTKNTVSDERLAVFLRHAMKPDEIAGPKSAERVDELLGWFKRYLEGHANPKWLVAHAAELAYALQSLRSSIPGGVGVKVKKLKWQTLTPGFSLQRSACLLGDYRVWEDADGAWEWALNDEKHSDGCEETPDAAKAAAQADYERRILSALTEQQGEAVAWQSKLGPQGKWADDPLGFDADFRAKSIEAGAQYRPLYAAPSNPVISDEWLRDTAMNVMLATEVDEAVRILTAALSVKPQSGENL